MKKMKGGSEINMKKIMLVLLLGMFLVGFAVAQGQEVKQELKTNLQTQQKLMSGEYAGENGQQIMVQKQSENQMQLKVNGISADCGLDLTQKQIQNKTKLETKLSNGRNAEIKVMPDSASEKALERLRLKTCVEEEGCSLELKEVMQNKEVKLAYELKTQRQAKVFGLFRTEMQVQAQVDAETGEIIQTKKPWWAFLASEPEEK